MSRDLNAEFASTMSAFLVQNPSFAADPGLRPVIDKFVMDIFDGCVKSYNSIHSDAPIPFPGETFTTQKEIQDKDKSGVMEEILMHDTNGNITEVILRDRTGNIQTLVAGAVIDNISGLRDAIQNDVAKKLINQLVLNPFPAGDTYLSEILTNRGVDPARMPTPGRFRQLTYLCGVVPIPDSGHVANGIVFDQYGVPL